jgi:hypothetical protein
VHGDEVVQLVSTESRPVNDIAESNVAERVDLVEEQPVLLLCGPIAFPAEVVFMKELEGRVGNFGTCIFGGWGVNGSAELSWQLVEVGLLGDVKVDDGVVLVLGVVWSQVSVDGVVDDVGVGDDAVVLWLDEVGVSQVSEDDNADVVGLDVGSTAAGVAVTDSSQAVLEVEVSEHPQWLDVEVELVVISATCCVSQPLSEC